MYLNYIIPPQFRVTVKDAVTGSYVAHAKVCLNKPNDIYKVGYTDANGQITFTITPQTTGTIKVTVTRIHDNNTYIQYFPSQTYCQVIIEPGGGQSYDSEGTPITLCISEMPTILKNTNVLIKFSIPNEGDVSLSIYDATGARARIINLPNLTSGHHKTKIEAKDLSNGVYFVVLQQNNLKVSKKFILVR